MLSLSDGAYGQESTPLGGLVPTDGVQGDFASIAAYARNLSTEPHRQARPRLPAPFADLGYDAYRAIRPESVPLSKSGGQFVFDPLPPGYIFGEPVAISIVDGGTTYDLPFNPGLFSFDPSHFEAEAVADALEGGLPDDVGYSGLRLRAPFNRPDAHDEFAVFHGASYFRAVSRGLIYGLSARGLAIDTAAAQGEEFPRFTHFWLERPEADSQDVVVRALLESASCTGAFEFTITPLESTVMQVRSRLFPRTELPGVGIAPLTSMYFFGPARRALADDFRDAVHDSAGLQMITGSGRRLWRALSNPANLQVSSFVDENPQGFGLVQRQRDFGFYQDDEARYEKRPSCWIEPSGDWGPGSVILVEIPVNSEFHDNIVAFWRPAEALQPTEEGHDFSYRLHWSALPPDTAPIGRVFATRTGSAVNNGEGRTIVVDFEREDPWPGELRAEAHAQGERIEAVALRPLPENRGMRASFSFVPGDRQLIEFDLTLMGPDGPETESWLYRWTQP